MKVNRFLSIEKRVAALEAQDFGQFGQVRRPRRKIPVLYIAG